MSSTNKYLACKAVILRRKGKKPRKIYIPNDKLKKKLQSFIPVLNQIYSENVVYHCDHAFVKHRNCITNASVHIRPRFVLKTDIERFFESIHSHHVKKYIPNLENYQECFVNDALAQGYPSSPILADIAMIDVDRMIVESMQRASGVVLYSRYADDLTFSFDDVHLKDFVIGEVAKIFRYFGFKINNRKTHLFDKNNGRVIITGVGVSYHGVHPTRKSIKKLRAAIHQGNENSRDGLKEWVACKYPKQSKTSTTVDASS